MLLIVLTVGGGEADLRLYIIYVRFLKTVAWVILQAISHCWGHVVLLKEVRL
jgi:hypothetical protein